MKEKNNFIDINSNPIILFKKWYEEAKESEINDPNAMNLATISQNLKPSSRIVLLKSYDESGFVFYTNIESKKGNSIRNNQNVALNFHWKSLQRQIRIEGLARLVSNEESDQYFESRPINSKIGAWASKQSSILSSRKYLEEKVNEYNKIYENKKIPRPDFWKGFRVKPNLIEFWQEKPFRLHDRVEFKNDGDSWIVRRLFP